MKNEKQFISNLELGVALFQDRVPKRVLSVSHNDGDGLTASATICKTLDFLKIPHVQTIYERSDPWNVFFKKILSRYNGIDTIIVSDLGAEEKQLCTIFEEQEGINLFILDHHTVPPAERVDQYPENVCSMNSSRFGYDGLVEIAGCTLAYMFCTRLTTRARKLSWLPVIGMAGDSLRNPKDYESYNKDICEEAKEENLVEVHEGVALLGAMAERSIKDGLTYSILPFIKEIGGNPKNAEKLLLKANINPDLEIVSLTSAQINGLSVSLDEPVFGQSIMINGKEGILKHSFEYNFFISIIGDTDYKGALAILDKKKPSKEDETTYKDYLTRLVSNLASITRNPVCEGNYFNFYEFPAVNKQVVSDTASFTSVNHLLPSKKMLIIATKSSDDEYKLSLRCSREFISMYGFGMGTIISRLSERFGGRGGGHDMAGGWVMPAKVYSTFKTNIQDIDSECILLQKGELTRV